MTPESSGRPVVKLQASPALPIGGLFCVCSCSDGICVITFGYFVVTLVVFFEIWLRNSPFTYLFCVLGCSGDPFGPSKTIENVVLSSNFKVSLKSRKFGSQTPFETIWGHFRTLLGRRWPPWGSLGRP